MALTLTNLIPDMYEALDVVSRELVGYVPAVTRDSNAERAAVGQTVRVPVTQASAAADSTPGTTAPNTGDAIVDNVGIQITKSRHVPVRHNGEEKRGLENAGTFSTIQADRFFQAMRTLVNEIEADLHAEARVNASRAYGTAGTTPFGTAGDLTDFAGVLRILEENGAAGLDLNLVLGHAAMMNMRGKQTLLSKVNESGSADMLRNGITDRVQGLAIRRSDVPTVVTKGTGTGYLVNNGSGIAIGGTVIANDTGTGTLLAGDVVTFAADGNNKYVANTTLAGGTFNLGKPGARILLPDNNAITIGNNFTPNVAFARSALVLATRAPAMPDGGDMADDVMSITDPRTGLTFELALYRQFLQNVIHVRLAWGVKAIKQEHIALLLG